MPEERKRQRRIKLGIPSAEMHGGLHMCHIDEKSHSRLRTAFIEIIHLLCERSAGFAYEHAKQLFPVSYALREVGTFEPGVPGKLRELWEAIDGAVENARLNGDEDGANLIKRLASGSASIQEFNEATISGKES